MQQLVKPSEYAKMHGLSRQSVYAKIKRGTLPSRKVDGRYYVIVADTMEPKSDNAASTEEEIEHVSLIEEYREILRAKDETIEVLKASIEDLKEANAQITQTLQQEITLLKQAFNEMKAIYRRGYMLPHTETVSPAVKEEHPIEVEPEEVDKQTKKAEKPKSKASKKEKKGKSKEDEEECWIPLGDLIQRQQYNYNKAKQVVKRFKKAYKRGDRRIKKQNGIYYISCYDFYEDILE
ncbi:DUF3972 domain-containing protein [Hydrogenimonas sp. SS33]|uniref:DUF3972 domain-containing protein n=1 Tax=Hydrogenimonas leucolamina TaxID=2954236 RepID=UPI00336BF9DB